MSIDGVITGPLPHPVSEAVGHLATESGFTCEVLGRLQGGLQGGSWLVEDASGKRLVLKVTTGRQLLARRGETTALVRELVERGYPTPVWQRSGITSSGVGFALMGVADGMTPTWRTLDLPRLLDAIELQTDAAAPSASTWSDYAMNVVTQESDAIVTLRSAGRDASAFADHALRLAGQLGPITLPRRDAVHGDMGLGNLLVTATGQISIIDIDACGPGTRAIDHAWLYREAVTASAPQAAASMIRRAGESVVGAEGFRFLVIVACCELLSFQMKRPSGTTGQEAAALRACVDSLG